MLIKIRERSSGFIAYVIVGLLSIPFALWGIQSYFGTLAPTVLQVGDMEVDANQYSQAFLESKRRIQSSLAEGEVPSDERVRTQALGGLARGLLIEQGVAEFGYRVSDRSLAEAIALVPGFQNDRGRFDPERYRAWLQAEQTSRASYENGLRQSMEQNQLLKSVSFSSFTLESEQANYSRLYNEERKVRYLVLDTGGFVDHDSVTGEDVQSEYDGNKDRYMSDLEVRLRYIELDVAELFDLEEADDEVVRAYYEDNSDDFLEPEQRRARHILFDTVELDEEEIERRIEEVFAKLAAGEDFAELAAEYSDDFLTAEDGGELPAVSEFDIDNDAVREALFSMTEDEVSEPLPGRSGVQIFQLIEIIPEEQRAFEEVDDEIADLIKLESARDKYATLYEEITQLVNSGSAQLFEEAQLQLDVASTTTEWLKHGSRDGIFVYPVVRRVVFESLLSGDAPHSGLVNLVEDSRAVLFGLDDVKEPRQLEFEEVKEDIRDKLLTDKALAKAGEQREAWLKQVAAGEETLEVIAHGEKAEIESPGYIRRDAPADEIPVPVTLAAFGAAYTGEAPVYLPIELGGDRAILELSDVKPGEEEAPPVSFISREEGAVLESLREVFKIEVFPDNFPK